MFGRWLIIDVYYSYGSQSIDINTCSECLCLFGWQSIDTYCTYVCVQFANDKVQISIGLVDVYALPKQLDLCVHKIVNEKV
jgi:hypothetical protein